MTVGFISTASDLDTLFASGVTPSFDSGYNLSGYGNLSARYAPRAEGSEASPTGFLRAGVDLNQYFAQFGSVAPGGLWPIGGGFSVGVNGTERFVTDTITAYIGRQAYEVSNSSGTPGQGAITSNLVADRFNLCGAPTANAQGSPSDIGSFVLGTSYGLTAATVLRFAAYTDNLSGESTWDVTVGAASTQRSNWIAMHTGGVAFCANDVEYYDDVPNYFDFSPGTGLYYGMFTPYINWVSPNNWVLRIASTFACATSSPLLNVIRMKVTRIS